MADLTWTEEEMILAADVADSIGWRGVRTTTPQVIELSKLLRSARIHAHEDRDANFRSPGGVSYKINNLRASHPGQTSTLRATEREKKVVNAFLQRRLVMVGGAREIRQTIAADEDPAGIAEELYDLVFSSEDPLRQSKAQFVCEGDETMALGLRRSRDASLRKAKIEATLQAGHGLACEVCSFNFELFYGARGQGYIEVHHKTPLHVSGPTQTSLNDLALLCSNCHRMIHRGNWLTPQALSRSLEQYGRNVGSRVPGRSSS